jgi:hypothetical protein
MKNSTQKKRICKLLLISICLLSTINHSDAQTTIGGVISSNTTLLLSNSPYIVTNNLLVQQGVNVTVEPGVIFKFNQGIYLQVDGEFQAIGTTSDSIIFTTNTGVTEWNGIRFPNSSIDYNTQTGSGCILENCVVENVNVQGSFAISINASSPKISSSSIRNCSWVGIETNGNKPRPLIVNNKIHDMGIGILASNNNWGLIQGNEIYNINDLEAVRLNRVVFVDNYVHDCPNAMAVRVQDTAIINNNVFENSKVAVGIIGGNAHIVKCNTFNNNETNMVITCERHPLLINNNFLNYQDWNVYWDDYYYPYGNGSCSMPNGSGVYATIDMANNYWGGLNNQQMDSSIWDFSDDFSLKALISYIPVLTDTADYTQVDCSNPLAVNEISAQNNTIDFFPNPFSDNAYLRIRGKLLNEKYDVSIINIYGTVVKKVLVTSSEMVKISRENLTSGIYLCQIISPEKKRYSAKIIIQ